MRGAKGCKWSSLNVPGTETLSLIQFCSWVNSLFPLIALWGNKNWPPSMKVKKMKIFRNKMGLKGCKWSSLNAPGPQTHLSHPILELGEFPFSIESPMYTESQWSEWTFRLERRAREFDEPAPQVVRFTVLGLGLTESAERCAAPRTMTRLANHAKQWLRSCFDNARALQQIRWFC